VGSSAVPHGSSSLFFEKLTAEQLEFIRAHEEAGRVLKSTTLRIECGTGRIARYEIDGR